MNPIERIEKEKEELLKKIGAPTEKEASDDLAKSPTDPPDELVTTDGDEEDEDQLATPSELESLQKDLEQSELRLKGFRRAHEAKVTEFKEVISNLRSEVTKLKRELEESKVKPDIFDGVFTTEDSDMVGEEAIELVKKASRVANERATAPIRKELEELRRKQEADEQAQTKSKVQEDYNLFLSQLAKAVPDYAELNVDKGFLKYINEVDPESGYIRHELFRRAEKSRDVGRVASFMREYKGLTKKSKDKLESKITPTGSKVAQSINKEKENKTLSMDSIREYYRDVQLGKYRGREDERVSIERKIDQALASGNIRS